MFLRLGLHEHLRMQSILSIQNSNSLIKMIDRTAFDKQINAIRQRYNKLCVQGQQQCRKNIEQKQIFLPSPELDYDKFITPVKVNKNKVYQEPISFSTTPQRTLVQSIPKSSRKQIEDNFGDKYQVDKQRMCLTSRQQSKIVKNQVSLLNAKESMLLQRMKQNERLLLKSKQLRDQQYRSKSSTQNWKCSDTEKELESLKGEKENQRERKNNEEKMPIFVRQQNREKRSDIACKTARTYDNILKEKENNLEDNYHKAKLAFYQRTCLVLNETKTDKQKSQKVEKSESIKPQLWKIQTKVPLSARETKEKSKIQASINECRKPEPKIGDIFANTAKIQERIRALLFYH